MSKASKKQVENYIDDSGVYCLHCGSDDLNAHNYEGDCGIITQYIECGNCGKDWTDVYRLIGVKEE